MVDRLRLFVLFSIVLSVLLAASAAAESWCAVPSAGDWSCYLNSSYAPGAGDFSLCAAGTPFSQCCTLKLGGAYLTVADDRCTQVCCCDQNTPSSAYESAPISLSRCKTYGSYLQEPVPWDDDCVKACGGSGGAVGSSFAMSGHVYDIQTGVPQPLQSARVEYPLGSRLVTFYTDTNGAYALSNVPAGLVAFKASKTGCGVNQTTISVTAATTLDFTLNCATGNCVAAAVNDTTAAPVKGEPQVKVAWTPVTCTNIQGYDVYRCEGTAASCTGDVLVGYATPGESSITDANVPADKGFCYKVKVVNATGGELDQQLTQSTPAYASHCILPMNAYCVAGPAAGSACFNNDVALQPVTIDASGNAVTITPFSGAAHCDATNRVQIDTDCGSKGQFCSDPNAPNPCRSASDCEKCNGVFGFFVDIAARIGGTSCSQLAGCVLDNNGYASDTFEACGAISSCADYRSKAACEQNQNGKDKCGTTQSGCAWKDAGLAELGKGACVPKIGVPECTRCEDVFGAACDSVACAAMSVSSAPAGSCYFASPQETDGIDPSSLPAGCVGKAEMACRSYATKQDCVGAGGVKVNVTYNKPDTLDAVRINGTNRVMTQSTDALGLGTCAWVADASQPNGGYCVKDANGLLPALPGLGRQDDDCFEQDPLPRDMAACLRDVTPPITTLPFRDGDYIDANRLRASKPIVSDDTFAPDQLTTRFCLVLKGGSCYPDNSIDNLVPAQLGVGSYTLHYYSEDPAGNLEAVRFIDLNIDQDSNAHLVEAKLVR